MTTLNKDFRVRYGLIVDDKITLQGNLIAGDATDNSHAITKSYIDQKLFAKVQSSAPSDPFAGNLWFDTTENRLNVYTGSAWITIASKSDTDSLQDHIHDDAIEGTGRITEVIS